MLGLGMSAKTLLFETFPAPRSTSNTRICDGLFGPSVKPVSQIYSFISSGEKQRPFGSTKSLTTILMSPDFGSTRKTFFLSCSGPYATLGDAIRRIGMHITTGCVVRRATLVQSL